MINNTKTQGEVKQLFGILTKIKTWASNEIHSNVPKTTWFPHKTGIMISKYTKIGENCSIWNNVSIGGKVIHQGQTVKHQAPQIEDNVIILSNACITGNITIGRGAVIGAGSVVTKSIPPLTVVAGNPAKKLYTIKEPIRF